MAQFDILRRVLISGTFVTTLAVATPVADEHIVRTGTVHKTTSHASVESSVEAGAIGLLGTAAWLLGGRLRKRLQPPN